MSGLRRRSIDKEQRFATEHTVQITKAPFHRVPQLSQVVCGCGWLSTWQEIRYYDAPDNKLVYDEDVLALQEEWQQHIARVRDSADGRDPEMREWEVTIGE